MPDSHLLNTTNIVNLDTYLANNYVTQDTGQTITGQKVFTETLYLKSNAKFNSSEVATNTTTPSATKSFHLYHTAKDNTVMGSLTFSSNSNGKNYAYLNAQKGNVVSTVSVDVDDNGLQRAFAPAPQTSASTSCAFIATTGWVNDPDKSTNVVHRSGKEVLTDVKTVYTSSMHVLDFKTSNIATNGTTPNEEKTQYVRFLANDDSILGYLGTDIHPSGSNIIYIMARKNVDGTNVSNYFSIQVTSAGIARTIAYPPSSDTANDNQVATTGWVNTANKTGYGIGAPNYAASQQITLNSSNQYTATENGWILAEVYSGSKVTISNFVPAYSSQGQTDTVFPIAKGQTMTVIGSGKFFFIPCMG